MRFVNLSKELIRYESYNCEVSNPVMSLLHSITLKITTLLLNKYLRERTTCMDRVAMIYTERNKWYLLTCVSLAIVSRLTQIIRSIDPTVANFQVNDQDLCEIRGDENHNLLLSLLLKLLYYTIEKCQFEYPL